MNTGTEFWRKETRNFRIVALAFEEDCPVDVDDDGETARKVANGTMLHFRVETRVYHKPTGLKIGTDHLGGCLYRALEDFVDYRGAKNGGVVYGGYFSDMVRTAIDEARNTLETLTTTRRRHTV